MSDDLDLILLVRSVALVKSGGRTDAKGLNGRVKHVLKYKLTLD
jgi:hypothetical protein